jgi:hypothetical protein
MNKVVNVDLKMIVKPNRIPVIECEALRLEGFVLGAMAAETTRVGVAALLLFDALQPMKIFLLNVNESRTKNEKRKKDFYFLS